MSEIIPTNTCPPDLAELSQRSMAFTQFSKYVHLDVGDGSFTSVISWPCGEKQFAELLTMASGQSKLPYSNEISYEVHLMVNEPQDLGLQFARAGAKRIIAHVEAFQDATEAHSSLDLWKDGGAREVGLAILIDTPLTVIEPLVPICDVIQLMSIETIGAQGAKFDPRVIARIEELHKKFPKKVLAVDGGVNEKNIALLTAAGASRFCVGAAIVKAKNPANAYRKIVELVG